MPGADNSRSSLPLAEMNIEQNPSRLVLYRHVGCGSACDFVKIPSATEPVSSVFPYGGCSSAG